MRSYQPGKDSITEAIESVQKSTAVNEFFRASVIEDLKSRRACPAKVLEKFSPDSKEKNDASDANLNSQNRPKYKDWKYYAMAALGLKI